jgi:fatty-acyl-CoA synthase
VGSTSFEPLTPTAFLDRAANVFPTTTAVVDGALRLTYAELRSRARRLAGGLAGLGVRTGDRVAVLAPNTHMLLEAHSGIPWAGGVIVAMNTRLATAELTYIIEHSDARVLLHDASLTDVARDLATGLGRPVELVEAGSADSDYERRLAAADELAVPVADERSLLALNYTSGTTGNPKGVEYHHRGAYLQAVAMAFHAELNAASTFLWTLPMFHCNGWCFPWAVTAAGATHLCLEQVDPDRIWHHLLHDEVTHFNGAPTVLSMVADHPRAEPLARPVRVGTGGAPPSPTILERMSELNIEVTHLYGLTETFGPTVLCDWHPEWDDLPQDERARMKARQGVGNLVAQSLRVLGPDGADVPRDGASIGEVVLRGNNVMLGYHRDPDATAAALTEDGWFRTGDLGVVHPDGYLELRDRSKDIIISGGENISTIEVEQALASHPAVAEVAVIGVPHDRWGEVPAAFVTLRAGSEATAEDLIEHALARIARFKAPKHVVFGPLPKTSTGKVQKFRLREEAALRQLGRLTS